MMNKKGQGALEFLTTYGWAFLVILIMIGALGYFGILNPTRFLPERCNPTAGFSCSEFQITRDSATAFNFDIFLENSLGSRVEFNTSTPEIILRTDIITGARNNTAISFNCAPAVGTHGIDPGQILHLQCNVTDVNGVPGRNSKLKIDVDIPYREVGKNLWRTASIEVFATVQE